MLKNLTFTLARGEKLALLGPNGSGKSTLLRILSTLLPLQQGEAFVLGHDLRRPGTALRRALGVVFQQAALDRKLSIEENLRCQGALYGLSAKQRRERSQTLLGHFDLQKRRNERVEKLSGGLQRRVELAKALLHHPQLLLLDEPTSGLDPAVRRQFWDLLATLPHSETRIVATHLMDEAERCTQVALIDEGQLVALAPPETLKTRLGSGFLALQTNDVPALCAFLQRNGHAPSPNENNTHENNTVGKTVRIPLSVAAQRSVLEALLREAPQLLEGFQRQQPTLEDVFVALTGRQLQNPSPDSSQDAPPDAPPDPPHARASA